ncbi:uncharacterized protein LOC115590188 [Sparus aurata]|uniref:uncharacterized protein LOC115578675 n=1 Tax=Sparus aurata TaxID=8175 RepID=UPI0011C165D3|nr:uncharacterized protein LOC115578675 [Sparus aurata]XP_030287313.1 uncharacterized protein LOC115590188 [Sparus aurata]
MESKRKRNWREEEILFLVELVEERKLIIKGKFSPTLTSHDKKQAWEDIGNQLYTSQAFSHLSPADCEKKWYNVLSKSRPEIAAFKACSMRTGGGPPGKDLSAVAEVVQRILGEDNPSISVLDGGQDPAAMKLELLSKGLDRDALRESPVSPGISDAHSPCALTRCSQAQALRVRQRASISPQCHPLLATPNHLGHLWRSLKYLGE